MLSTTSAPVIEATLPVVGAHIGEISGVFYDTMLGENPDLLHLFSRSAQATGEQKSALAGAVAAFAAHLVGAGPDAAVFDHIVERIAQRHCALGIRPEQYTMVGRYLLRAVGTVLGDAVTPEIAAAWDEVYWLFAAQLIAAEARIYAETGVDPTQVMRPYRLVRTIEETADVASFVLEPADGQPVPPTAPGQYVSVFVDLPHGRRQGRQYTVSSTASGTRLQITVRRVRGVGGAPDGEVSTFLHDHLAVGDLVDVSAPAGDFVITEADTPLLLASADAGITTVLPIVEHVAKTQPERTVIVAHADRTAADHALRDTVQHVGRLLDDFTSYTWYEKVAAGDTRSRPGLMDLSQIELPPDVQVFTCGPLPFMRHIRSSLISRGVPADRIRYEVFGPDLWAAQIQA